MNFAPNCVSQLRKRKRGWWLLFKDGIVVKKGGKLCCFVENSGCVSCRLYSYIHVPCSHNRSSILELFAIFGL